MKTLVIIDVQQDFVSGVFGTPEAQAIISPLCDLIKSWKGDIIVTLDTHNCDYLETREGRCLPVPHCVKPSRGWQLDDEVSQVLSMKQHVKYIEKSSFGQFNWPIDDGEITIVGLVSDICVLNNALIIRNIYPNRVVNIIEECCAGTTVENHNKAMDLLRINHINIL